MRHCDRKQKNKKKDSVPNLSAMSGDGRRIYQFGSHVQLREKAAAHEGVRQCLGIQVTNESC